MHQRHFEIDDNGAEHSGTVATGDLTRPDDEGHVSTPRPCERSLVTSHVDNTRWIYLSFDIFIVDVYVVVFFI